MVKVALLLDDVSLISSHNTQIVAEKGLQRAAIGVAKWSTNGVLIDPTLHKLP